MVEEPDEIETGKAPQSSTDPIVVAADPRQSPDPGGTSEAPTEAAPTKPSAEGSPPRVSVQDELGHEDDPNPDPHEIATHNGTFRLISRMTVVVGSACLVLLVTPYVGMMYWLIQSHSLDVGCRIAVANHLFHVFCVHSIRFFGTAFGGIVALSGALFLLNKLHAPFKIEGQHSQSTRMSFETASPGLVMVVAGVALVLAGMYREQTMESPAWMCVDKTASADRGSQTTVSNERPLTPGCSPTLEDCDGGTPPDEPESPTGNGEE